MAAVILSNAPRPRVFWEQQSDSAPTAYAAIRVAAAVNLTEERSYSLLSRRDRLSALLREEQTLINTMSAGAGRVAFDLRFLTDPGRSVPTEAVILVRAWDTPGVVGPPAETAVAEWVHQLQAGMPRHVLTETVEDRAELAALLRPFGREEPIRSAVITKREVVGVPQRPDAKVGYYFSVAPFNWAENDWSQLFLSLAASPVRVAVSVALMPVQVPPALTESLRQAATFYGRLARPDTWQGGLYFGEQTLPPDAFAVEAERVYADYARRYSGPSFVMRVQVSAAPQIPRGLPELLGSLISPSESGAGTHLEWDRTSAAFGLRVPRLPTESDLARWNFEAVDFILLPGDPTIWSRPDPPAQQMRVLSVLGDAKDASCALRLPAALDGTVAGFRVRRGRFGQEESLVTSGPSLQLGSLAGGRPLRAGLDSLTKHVLVAGSTGSGKTTTVLELLRQIWCDHMIPFLVIEPVNSDANDYRRFLAEPGFEAAEVVTVGDEGQRPLRFNPFEVPKGVLVAEHQANLLACFKAAFGLWEPLPSIYQDALNLTYLDAGILASERSEGASRGWPTAVEFMRSMTTVTKDLGYAGEIKANIEAASVIRAKQMASGVSASSFLTSVANQIGDLLDHPVILELKSLGSGDEQALMMALLLNAITEHYQAARGASAHLVHLTVIEEAHRLLGRPTGGRAQEEGQAKEKAAETFANTLAENRKYGEGIVIVEQIPSKLVVDAVKNTNLKVLHRLTAEEDRRYLGETMGLDEPQLRFATRLQTGEALVYSDEMAEAMQIDVIPRLDAAVPVAVAPAAGVPFAACEVCRAQCRYRGAALAMVRNPTLVDGLRARVAALEDRSAPPAEVATRWAALLDDLRRHVGGFSALPSVDPGLSDAAYCLFLHSLAIRTTRFAPTWPRAVARRLGVTRS